MNINIGLNLSDKEKIELNSFLHNIMLLNTDLEYTVYLLEESLKEKIHKKYFTTKFSNENCYRAFTFPAKKVIFVFYNRGETLESLKWLISHELTHANLRQNKYLRSLLNLNLRREMNENNISSLENYEKMLESDSFHENLLEEQICNEFATNMIGKNYDRLWWKKQLRKIS